MKVKITYFPLSMPKAFMDNIQAIEDDLTESFKIPNELLKMRDTRTATEVKLAICCDCGFQHGSIHCYGCRYFN